MTDKNSKVVHITDSNFKTEVLDHSTPVLVDFWAPWCRPCLMVAPILDELSNDLDGKLKIVKMNVDENQKIAGQLNVQAIPTMLIYKNGKVDNSIIGVRPKQELLRIIEEILN
jgi:thioredoxin